MSSTISPNMNLIVPGVGTEAGPAYATEINSSLGIIDAHDHTPGSGVAITSDAININSALTLNNNFLTNIAGLTLFAQGTPPAINTIYQSGVDLYFLDGDGNSVRLTASGAVAGTPGSIANLVAPASATYVAIASTFVWQSDANIAANMDFGAAIMRNISPNSTNSLTLQPPNLTSSYTITLPVLPVAESLMTINASGAIHTPAVYPLPQAALAANSVGTSQIIDASVTLAKIASGIIPGARTAVYTTSGTFLVPAGVTGAWIFASGGGGGGGGGGSGPNGSGGGGGGSGGGGVVPVAVYRTFNPGDTLNITIGAGGAGGAGSAGGVAGSNGSGGGTTIVDLNGTSYLAFSAGGNGGAFGLPNATGAGAGVASGFNGSGLVVGSGSGGAGHNAGSGTGFAGAGGATSTWAQPSTGGAGNGVSYTGGGGGGGGSGITTGGNGGNGGQTAGVAGSVGSAGGISAGGGGGGGASTSGVSYAGGNGGTGFALIVYIGA